MDWFEVCALGILLLTLGVLFRIETALSTEIRLQQDKIISLLGDVKAELRWSGREHRLHAESASRNAVVKRTPDVTSREQTRDPIRPDRQA
ncbi:MAG: hypothetical protein AB1898_06965 [Acidobacteriota bacterium]